MPPAFLLATSTAVAKPGGWQRMVNPLTLRLWVTSAMPGLLMTGAITGDMD